METPPVKHDYHQPLAVNTVLLAAGVPERPGAHTEDYWQAALPYQLLFFQQVLKANGVLLP
jgi:hypothetical protein